jgi:FtsP/CotA-like multicopper oxidase with cupredoxin domain
VSRPARTLTILGAVLALAVAGFLLLRPSGDDPETSASTPVATTTTDATTPTSTAPAPKPKPKAVAAVPIVKVRGGEPTGGVQKITASKGETVRFRVSADAPDEVHVHGFDIEKPVAPGEPASFRFPADIEGRFEVELHGSGAQIAEVVVNP